MKTARRFLDDESGMTLPLAMIMIVLMGVMGAGLLAFTNRDINTVVEENRGQRAFEVADAGVGVAKRQLTSDCAGNTTCVDHYDDFAAEVLGTEDIQWSWINDGVTLTDLDGDGDSTDSVNVTIDYSYVRDDFRIISTGTYGESKRKIEVILKGTGGSFGGQGIGHPVFYTPSDITIEGDPAEDIQLSGISLFSQQDIIIEGLQSTRQSSTEPEGRALRTDFEDSNYGVFDLPGTNDFLGDWYSPGFPAARRGDWNTVERRGYEGTEIGAYSNSQGCARANRDCVNPGLAAQGRICGVPAGSNIGNCRDPISGTSIHSIADGVYGYDCTTGPVLVAGCTRDAAAGEVSRGKRLTFVRKQPTVNPTTGQTTWGANQAGTITYPFPLLQPKEARLKRIAQEQQADGTGGYYYRGCSPPWNTIFGHPEQDETDVIFIDAGDCVDPIDMSFGGTQDGIMVVWCGDLHHTNDTKYRGILMNLIGDGSTFGSSNCEVDMSKGVYRIDDGSEMFGWLYSEGGTITRSGIEIGAGTTLHFRSGATWNFLDDVLSGSPPTAFVVKSWRELYED